MRCNVSSSVALQPLHAGEGSIDATSPSHTASGATISDLKKCTYVQYIMISIAIKVQKKLCSIAPSDKTCLSVLLDRIRRCLPVNAAVCGNRHFIGVLDSAER